MSRFWIAKLLVLYLLSAALLSACDDKLATTVATPETTPTLAPTLTPTAAPTREPTPEPTPTATPEATPEPTPVPEPTPSPTSTPRPTATPTPESMPEPTPTPTPRPTATPTPKPTPEPTPTPTPRPTPTSTPEPTPSPREVAASSLSQILSWLEDPAQGAETDAVETLIDLWVADADVAEQVAALPWASDGVDSLERDALRSLLGVTTTDALLAGEIIAFPWIVDSITEAESSILDRLVGIASSDTDLANQVVSLPWLVDGVTDDERVMLTALNRILTTDTTLAKRVAALPWFIDDVEEVEWGLLDQLLGIAFRNIDLANQVVSLSWLVDSVTDAESAVITAFAAARSEDVEFVNWAVTLPWLGDGVTEAETAALRHALRLGEIDPDLAWATAVLPWFVDGLTGDERNAVDFLQSIATAELRGASEGDMGAQLAKLLLSRPWLADGVIHSEAAVIHALLNIAERDLNLARQIAALPWLAVVANSHEWSIATTLDGMSEKDLELAKQVADLAWFTDGVREPEGAALYLLGEIALSDVELAKELATLPWFADGATQLEGIARLSLIYFASIDVELAKELATLPWFVDGVTELESSALHSLATIASRDIKFARTVIGWPRFGGGVQRDLDFFLLHALGRSDPELLATLTARTWFDDGLTDEEAALVVTLAGQNPSLYKALLIDSHLYHESISLPLAGEVNVWLVQDTSPVLNQESLRQIEDAARIAEEFFGVPFPTTDLIVLVVTEGKSEYGHLVRHLGSLMSVIVSRGQLYGIPHEAAHYYLTSNFRGHPWFTEGGANFIEALVNHERGRQDISSRETVVLKEVQSFCTDSGVENIRHNAYLLERGQVSYFQCNYRLGEYLLLNLLKIMGKNALSSALNELYVSSGGHVPALRFSTPPSEEDIYETFLKHAPSQGDKVRKLFRDLHGGDFAFPEINFVDDEADEAENVKLVEIGEVVTGSLDYIFDFDYFQFQAEEGQSYRFGVAHETLGHTSITLYGPDGVSELRDMWQGRLMGSDGPLILWRAPSSEAYYFAVQNFGGKTGDYSFTIVPAEEATADDHGDSPGSATRIGRFKRIHGTIDDTFDEDYFRFNAYEGRVYHIFMRSKSTTDLCAQMYRADGNRSSEWHNRCDHGNLWEGGLVHGIRWVAPETGDFYLAISGFMESLGDYNFEIILALDPGNPN